MKVFLGYPVLRDRLLDLQANPSLDWRAHGTTDQKD
jgi:hypothetical protein